MTRTKFQTISINPFIGHFALKMNAINIHPVHRGLKGQGDTRWRCNSLFHKMSMALKSIEYIANLISNSDT